LAGLADLIGAPVEAAIARWNAQCAESLDDDFGRPPSSMLPIATSPYYVGEVWQLVSNTQGGPVHDAGQRILDPFGRPIAGLYAAGELGSAFGHLYMSGGNLAECFVGGEIAGHNAARGE
jgi:predicted oxidoreductase